MWHAMWVTLAGQTAAQFAGWLYLTPAQVDILHAWIRHDPYPCVYTMKDTGFREITLVDLNGTVVWHTPPCPAGIVA